jgi:hypothetical protein
MRSEGEKGNGEGKAGIKKIKSLCCLQEGSQPQKTMQFNPFFTRYFGLGTADRNTHTIMQEFLSLIS